MNRTSIAGALLLALTTPSAFAQGYVKLELGASAWDVDIADFDDGSLSGTLEPGDTLVGFGIGYAVNPHLAIETTWRDLGAATFEGSSNGAGSFWCAGPVSAELEGTSLDVTVLGKVPMDSQWALTGRLGVSQWNSTITLADSCGTLTGDDTGSSVTYGFGMERYVTEEVTFTVNWQMTPDVADEFDVMTGTVGLAFNF